MAQPDVSRCVYSPFAFAQLAANATTVVRTGPGVLHSIVINTKGAASNTISVYDAVTATNAIAIIDSTITTGAFVYDVLFATGLTIVIATGTAANITVCWT